jgi:hypothetical protein
MPSLAGRLAAVLAEVVSVTEEPDGALTVHYGGTLSSLRVVTIADELDLVSLTQMLAWDLPLNKKLRDRGAEHARDSQLGTVTLAEKVSETGAKRNSGKAADVMLRYNFPGSGLADDALRTLVLLVLEKGAEIRRDLAG